MSEEIYTPKGSYTLDTEDYLIQLRVGIEGEMGTGKSFAAATFKNPIFLSYDRGLVSHVGRKDIIEIPFHNDKFIDSLLPRQFPKYKDVRTNTEKLRPANRKDALPLWLSTEGLKLTRNQTLILDGSTGIQAAYHQGYWVEPRISNSGEVDKFAEWRQKIDYFTEIMMCIKALSCDVVYICHESQDRDKQGEPNGKIRPLISGQFVDELPSHFTDWYRAITIPKPSQEKMEDFKKKFKLNAAQAKEWIDSTPSWCETIYLWQTQSSDLAKCKTSMIGAPYYVIADYKTFGKYKRQQQAT